MKNTTFYFYILSISLLSVFAATSVSEATVHTHIDCENIGDRVKWLTTWHPEVIFQDPVGGKEKRGLIAIENTWDRAFQPGHSWKLEPAFMSANGDQVAGPNKRKRPHQK